MASLKDLMVMGPARFLDTIYGTEFTGNSATATKWANKVSLKVGNSTKDLDGATNSITYSHSEIGATISSFNWTGNTTAGPTLNLSINGCTASTAQIPVASSSASGIVTTGDQTFGGTKTFAGIVDNGNASVYSKHHYHKEFDANRNVYVHFYDTSVNSTISSKANLRVWNGASSKFRLLYFDGDGNFTWDGDTILDAGNYTVYTVKKDGTGASGSWGINITGSAAKLTTARTLTIGNSGKSFDGSANVSWDLHDILYTSSLNTSTSWDITTPGVYYVASSSAFTGTGNPESANGGLTPYRYGQLIVSRASTGGMAQFYISHNDSNNSSYGIKFRSGWNSSYVSNWNTLLDSTNYINYTVKKDGTGATGTWGISVSGNSATATKLATARTLTIGNSGKNFDGNADVSWTLDEIGAIRSWSTVISCATWSRLCYIQAATNVIGSKFLLSIGATRNNVVYNDLFVITAHHSSMGRIVKISGNKYSTEYQLRVLANSTGDCYVELFDEIHGATSSTTMTVHCRIIPIYTGTLTKYTSFTSGATLPANFSVGQTMTIIKEADIQGSIEATKLSEVLSIDMGGTGASTPAAALGNLGGVSYTIVTNLNSLL